MTLNNFWSLTVKCKIKPLKDKKRFVAKDMKQLIHIAQRHHTDKEIIDALKSVINCDKKFERCEPLKTKINNLINKLEQKRGAAWFNDLSTVITDILTSGKVKLTGDNDFKAIKVSATGDVDYLNTPPTPQKVKLTKDLGYFATLWGLAKFFSKYLPSLDFLKKLLNQIDLQVAYLKKVKDKLDKGCK